MKEFEWASQVIERLLAIWPLDRTLQLAFPGPDHAVWQLYGDSAEAACNIQPDKITIYLRSEYVFDEQTVDVICHEYAHAALAPLVEHHQAQPETIEAYREDEYVQAVENAAKRLGGLLEYAARTATVRQPEMETPR